MAKPPYKRLFKTASTALAVLLMDMRLRMLCVCTPQNQTDRDWAEPFKQSSNWLQEFPHVVLYRCFKYILMVNIDEQHRLCHLHVNAPRILPAIRSSGLMPHFATIANEKNRHTNPTCGLGDSSAALHGG